MRPVTAGASPADRRQDLRDRIRDAAVAEFAEHGLRGASTQAIADRAGITKTRLHYYIDGKEALYREALDHIVGTWADLFLDTPADDGPEAFLRAYVRRKLAFSLANPDAVRLYASEVMRGAPMLSAHWERSRRSVERASDRLRAWAEAGLIRPVDPVLLQFHVWAMTQHYALHAAEARAYLGLGDGDALDGDAIAAEIAALVLGGLRP